MKLSTNEILPIDYNSTTVSLFNGDYIPTSSLISPPTTGNFTLALVNGDLYAFYAMVGDMTGTMAISKLYQNSLWLVLSYSTPSSDKIKYFDYPTVMTSANNGIETVFIYGGVLNNGITTRMLEFNPTAKNLTIVSTSSSPTAFYGGANCALDSTGASNLIIGGKAGTGWLSMFQIATWEYKTWSFKAVQSSSFSVNSRINPLVLPVFKQNDKQQDLNNVGSVMIIGGTLANNYSTPYVLSLNVTNDWNYQNYTSIGDFEFSTDLIGAIVVNDTLIAVKIDSSSSSKKRSTISEYSLSLYNVGNMKEIDSFQYINTASSVSSSVISSSSSATTAIISSSTTASTSSSSFSADSFLVTSASASASSSSFVSTSIQNKSNNTPMIIGIIVPILIVIILCIAGVFIYRKFFNSTNIEIHSINSSNASSVSNEPDYFKEVRNLEKEEEETHSISSWEHKRTEFQENLQLQRHSTNSQSSVFMQSNKSKDSVPLTHSPNPVSPSRKKKWRQSLTSLHSSSSRPTLQSSQSNHQINLNLDELENSDQDPFQQTSLTSDLMAGSKRSSFRLKKISDEDEEIDEFLGVRDVQVLVSSKRRSKLRITNPDLQRIDSAREDDIEEETEFESVVGSSVVDSGRSLGMLSNSSIANTSSIFNTHIEEESPFYKSLMASVSTTFNYNGEIGLDKNDKELVDDDLDAIEDK